MSKGLKREVQVDLYNLVYSDSHPCDVALFTSNVVTSAKNSITFYSFALFEPL